MKMILRLSSLLLLLLALTSCLEEDCQNQQTYIAYEPVYLEQDEFRIDITAETAKELCNPAGFYVYGDYLLIVEHNLGLHIFDNANPTSPVAVSFLPVGGAVGLSVRNNILYINNYVDLVTFDLTDPANPEMLNRTENVFDTYGIFNAELGYNQVVVEYVETEVTRTVECDDYYYGYGIYYEDDLVFAQEGSFGGQRRVSTSAVNSAFNSQSSADLNAGGTDEQVGLGGSLARFTITNSTLYVVNDYQLKAFDLSDPAVPIRSGTVDLNWGVETIFPAGDELYIGTATGMHIMDASDPLNPALLSTMEHVRACDPVVVKGDRAYVTLRGGSECNGFTNQLDVVDITDKTAPVLLQSFPMRGPVGLTTGNNLLFVCEPDFGMTIFELDETGMPTETTYELDELSMARDVIGLHSRNHLITIGEDGIRQLQYGQEGSIEPLSLLNICVDL